MNRSTNASHPAPNDGCPRLLGRALYGLAGDIVRKLRPDTEAHPAALLGEILLQFGNVIGRSPHCKVEGARHGANINSVKVGSTAKARKGTARNRITALFEQVDPAWMGRHFSGLSSGEGVIWNVRDDGEIADKRMYVRADEFAGTLAVMKRDGNTLSPVIRSAWDGIPLQITSKNNPAKSTDHHISISADITQDELQGALSQADKFNGFANRFLWQYTERAQKLPFGGGDLDLSDEVKRLKKAVEFARQQGRMYMDDNARKVWARAYEKLSEGEPGLLGAVTSRAEAQVIRLALIYALLDMSNKIRAEHLQAALAFWRYCEDSARYIFGALSPAQAQIVRFLADGPRTWPAIYRDLFAKHRPADLIKPDLETLIKMGLVRTKVVSGTECWELKE